MFAVFSLNFYVFLMFLIIKVPGVGEDSKIRINQINWNCVQDWPIFSCQFTLTQIHQCSKYWKSPFSVGEEPLPWASWGLPPSPGSGLPPSSSWCSGPWHLLDYQTAGIPFDQRVHAAWVIIKHFKTSVLHHLNYWPFITDHAFLGVPEFSPPGQPCPHDLLSGNANGRALWHRG